MVGPSGGTSREQKRIALCRRRGRRLRQRQPRCLDADALGAAATGQITGLDIECALRIDRQGEQAFQARHIEAGRDQQDFKPRPRERA
jgi:hypothetical protein